MAPGRFEELGSNPSGSQTSREARRRAHLSLRPVPKSVPQARHFVVALDFVESTDVDRLSLLTAEIVTNAILHARTHIELEASQVSRGIRVSVTDGNTNPPVMKNYGPGSPTGRGLHIVEAMADRWGFDPSETGKTVWFELDDEEER